MRFCALTYYKTWSLIMKIQLAAIGIVSAMAFAACETTPTTNANRASNSSNVATVVNSNSTGANANSMSPVTTTNSNTVVNANHSTINYNGTAKENEASRSSIEAQAKAAGGTIGQGAEDWWLWSKTNAALTTDANLHSSGGMNVDVVNGVITLKGTVPTKADIDEADKIGKSIVGKKGFQNKLTVSANGTSTTTNSNMKAPAKK